MNVDFYVYPQNNKIIIKDTTAPNEINPIQKISSMTITVKNNTCPIKEKTFNSLEWVIQNRKDRTVFEISNTDLGLEELDTFPDDVYEITWNVNNQYIRSKLVISWLTCYEKLTALITKHGYNFIVGENDVQYTGETCESDIEQIRIAVELTDFMRQKSTENDINACKNALDKLKRILEIIE